MAIGGSTWRDSLWARSTLIATAALLPALLRSACADAERSTFKTYATDQGLTSLNGSCLAHDAAGEVLICTEHGVFTYDGRRFLNLGLEQGLPLGDVVFGVAVTPAGRIAVQYANEVYVSDRASDPSHPTTSLSFKPVDHPGISFYDQQSHRLVPWRDGFAFLLGGETVEIAAPVGGRARVARMSRDGTERASLRSAEAIFSVDGHLWETFEDGRLCAAEPGMVRCYGAKDGLANGHWFDVVAGPNGRVLARSATTVATFDPAADRWSSAALPDQGGQYLNYNAELGLFRSPDGGLITQSVHGLDVLGPGGWRELTVADGAPDGIVVDAMTDRAGQLWFHILGRGLVRWIGYGHWNTVEKADGLSAGFPWQTTRSTDGALWVTTDGGVDRLVQQGSSTRVARVYPVASYALAATSNGKVLAGYEGKGLRVIDTATGASSLVASPAVATIVPGRDHAVWLGTTKGLYRIDDRGPYDAVLVKAWPAPVLSIARDGGGGVFYLSGGHLHHWYATRVDVTVSGPEWTDKLEPMELASARDGSLWIGGPRGLSHVVVSDDRIRSYQTVPIEDVGTTTIFAVMIDHRGWVWAGTSLGISVYDGRRWVSVNTDQGLLSNDVNEDGIREDPDGSVWISTTSGVSHLTDPASIFVEHPLSVMVIQAHLGARPVGSARLPYATDPLSIDLGTPNYAVERSVVFRHRLSGVDSGWVSSSSGVVSYPFIPPGRHLFTVTGYDQLAHRSSAPASIVIEMSYPWWRQWWAEALWAVLVAGLLHAGVRLRDRAMYARQAELERHVAEATEKLRYLASHDTLTGLLTRSEIERRLARKLAEGHAGEELVVALLDIDHFKRINDHHGHLGGDEVLRALGRSVLGALRGSEYAGRYGGEEILLVLSDADGCAAERVAGLHLAIRHDTVRIGDGPVRFSCSVGVAWAGTDDSWESLIGRADAALYRAKRAGRDRVVESHAEDARLSDVG